MIRCPDNKIINNSIFLSEINKKIIEWMVLGFTKGTSELKINQWDIPTYLIIIRIYYL